jgi:hypothetical protein
MPGSRALKMPVEIRAAALAVVPTVFAAVGAAIDEHLHQGFTIWRSSCRAAGLTLSSLISFTFDLMPLSLMGMLLGVFALQFAVAAHWHRPTGARIALGAHAGCLFGMSAGLLLCLWIASPAWMLAVELSVAAGLAAALARRPAAQHCNASVTLPTRRASNAY